MCIRDRGRTVARTWPLCAGPTATQTTWTTYSSSLAPERPRAPGSVSWPPAHQCAVPRCAGELSHRNRIGAARALDAGLRPDPFPDRAASLLPGLLAATRTGLSPAGDDELTNEDLLHQDPSDLLGARKIEASRSGQVCAGSSPATLTRASCVRHYWRIDSPIVANTGWR